MLHTAIVMALCSGAVEMRVSVPDVVFGDPVRVDVILYNSGSSSVGLVRRPELVLLDSGSRVVFAESVRPLLYNGSAAPAATLAPAQQLTIRLDAGLSLGNINWAVAQGVVVTEGLLLPGKYRIRASAETDAQESRLLTTESDLLVMVGDRSRELKIVRSMVAAVPTDSAPEYAAWTFAISSLQQCCPGTPLLEPIRRASCGAARELEAVRCIAEYLSTYPSSSWADRLKLRSALQLEQHERRKYLNELDRLPRAQLVRYSKVQALPQDRLEERLTLTKNFVRDFPQSPAAPALLAEAIHALRSVGRWEEADPLGLQLSLQYPNSFPVRSWNGADPLVRAKQDRRVP